MNINSIFSWFKGSQSNKSFMGVLHQAAEGSNAGRQYLVISNGKLELSSTKSEEEVSFKKLTEFVNEKLKNFSEQEEQEAQAVKQDLNKIKSLYKSEAEKLLNETKVFDLPTVLFKETIGFFDPEEITDLKIFKEDINLESYWKEQVKKLRQPSIEMWQKIGYDIGAIPPITTDQINDLREYYEKFHEFPIVCVIPEKITLNGLIELIKHPKEGKAINIDNIDMGGSILKEHGNKPIEASYCVHMTKDVLRDPDSTDKSYPEQRKLAQAIPGYDVPDLLEAIVCILTDYMSTGTTHYGKDPWTYTRCQEQSGRYQILVGGFGGPYGLFVGHSATGNVRIGVAALRKFF